MYLRKLEHIQALKNQHVFYKKVSDHEIWFFRSLLFGSVKNSAKFHDISFSRVQWIYKT